MIKWNKRVKEETSQPGISQIVQYTQTNNRIVMAVKLDKGWP
jgi:hypothetical protein